jgi:hypothetical protein
MANRNYNTKWPWNTYNKIFYPKAFQNKPKFAFFGMKIYSIWQPWYFIAFLGF